MDVQQVWGALRDLYSVGSVGFVSMQCDMTTAQRKDYQRRLGARNAGQLGAEGMSYTFVNR